MQPIVTIPDPDNARFIRDDDDCCPECGGYALRGCGAAWHDGKPDTHCSPLCGCRRNEMADRWGAEAERDALAAEVAALRTQLAAAERAGLAGNLDVIDHLSDAAQRLTAERDELRIAIHGGCQCPAPYTECPHDEPLLPALNRARAEVAALRTVVRHLSAGARPDGDYWVTDVGTSFGADEIVDEMTPDQHAAIARALTEDTPDTPQHAYQGVNGHPDDDECTHREDGTDLTYCGRPKAAHEDTPPVCATCKDEGMVDQFPFMHGGGPKIACPDCTEDTPDTPTEKATPPGGRCPGCGGRLAEYRAVPEFDECEKCGAEWPVDPPPDCTTCNDQRRIADPPGNSFGMGVPCPDCTEDTPDADV